MKVIQLTMEPELVERVDKRAKRIGTTRSGFTREALRAALERYDEAELEERHRTGYRKAPPVKEEFGIPESDHAWGDGAWKDERCVAVRSAGTASLTPTSAGRYWS